MMDNKLVIVFDCGATNVRAVAINALGQIEAMHAMPNATCADPFFEGGLIWDTQEIWQKFRICFKSIVPKIDIARIGAITVTTFGVNGAPVDSNGKQLYPVISWQCQRTEPIMTSIDKYISLDRLYAISGINAFSFNTINALLWLKENRPDIIDKMAGWLFIPSVFIHKLTGHLVNDTTMAGTSMLTDFNERTISTEILNAIHVPNKFFEIKEPGTIAGQLTHEAANEIGIPAGIPVVLAGHDTQFALIGSGAGENDAVLSSGTWEILMTRCKVADRTKKTLNAGLTNEFDAVNGLYNTGAQWLASGVLEWVKRTFYADLINNTQVYETMISEAESIKDQSGLHFSSDFVNNKGCISGIGLQTKREQIYRAALESLVDNTCRNLKMLEKTGNFKASSLILVGGGSKNRLWNQLRANRLGIPIKIAQQTETTVLGASLFAQTAIGTYKNIEEAINNICQNYRIVFPE